MTRQMFANFIVFSFSLFICSSTIIELCHCLPLDNEVQEGHHLHPHISSSSHLSSKSDASYPTSSDSSLKSLQEDFPVKPSSHDSSSSSDSVSSSGCSLKDLNSIFTEDEVIRKALEVYSKTRGAEQMKLLIQEATGLQFVGHINSIPVVHDSPPSVPSLSQELSIQDVHHHESPKKFHTESVVKSNQVTDSEDDDDGVHEFIGSVNGQASDSNRQDDQLQEQVDHGNGELDHAFDGEFRGTIDIPVNLDSSSESSSTRRRHFKNDVVVSRYFSRSTTYPVKEHLDPKYRHETEVMHSSHVTSSDNPLETIDNPQEVPV